MASDLKEFAGQKVKNVANGETKELQSFWQDQSTVIVFFRRWGCMFCRVWAKELSEIAPVLKKNNIKLVGVGVEEIGSKDFVNGKFFDGDLYYVEDASTYQKLGFKRMNMFNLLPSLLWKNSREAVYKGKSMGVGGDLKGDWYQTGGALLVEKGGNLLRHFVQNGPGEHLSNEEILKAFNLSHEYNPETMKNAKPEEIQCNLEAKS